MRKLFTAILAAGVLTGASLTAAGTAEARDGRNGAFLGGAALGVVGGALIGNAIANQRYYAPAPVYEVEPVYVEPACRWVIRDVPNHYDGGYHPERVRVCD